MSLQPLETAESLEFPTVQQISVFIDDQVGQLLRLTRLFERTEVRILGLMVVNSVDCAIVRMIVNDPTQACRTLVDHRFPLSETELLVADDSAMLAESSAAELARSRPGPVGKLGFSLSSTPDEP